MKCCRRRGVRSTPRESCRWMARWPSSPAHRAALGVRSPSRTRRRGRTWRSRTGRTAGADETADGARAAGRRAEAMRADVAEQGDLDALAETLRRTFGHVDVWVDNAGADILTGDAARLSRTEKLDRLLAVDLRGTVLASWKAVEVMDAHPPASGGVILNMSWDHVLGGGIKSEYAQCSAPRRAACTPSVGRSR